MRQTLIIILSLLLFSACRKHIEPQSVVGYIADYNEEMILIKCDTSSTRLEIDSNTVFEEKELIVGNIIEAIFLPTKDSDKLPIALEIYTDQTYPKALGHWQSRQNSALKIDIQLLSHGRIIQNSPQTTLKFTRWQISGKDNHIKLYGTLSLPAIKEKREDKEAKKSSNSLEIESQITTRRTTHFEVDAELATEDDAKNESHRVMIIRTEKGQRSTLYFTED